MRRIASARYCWPTPGEGPAQGNYLGRISYKVHTVHVHIAQPSSRALYAVEELLRGILGWEVVRVASVEELAHVDGPKLTYGQVRVPGALHVVPHGWLNSTGLALFDPQVVEVGDLPMLFPVDGGDLPFDPFAAVFFQLSRFEEWVGLEQDKHGRPITEQLHAVRHGYVHRPVVDEWALLLATTWRKMDPSVPLPQRSYRQFVTVDLDNGLKYLGRPLWRSCGSLVRDLLNGRWAEVPKRLRVLSGAARDPFILDEAVRSLFQKAAQRTIFFVLAAPRGEWDHAVPVEHSAYAPQLRALAERFEVGLHPSYFSSDRPTLIADERARLQQVIQRPVDRSRQHFLKLRVDSTLAELERSGFTEEHSLGLHDTLGFRCGTCTPYRWYDLATERPTSLVVHPFTVMDNTLREKLHLDVADAVEAVRPIIAAVKRVDGTFIGLWHESFLEATDEAPSWRTAILRIIEEAAP